MATRHRLRAPFFGALRAVPYPALNRAISGFGRLEARLRGTMAVRDARRALQRCFSEAGAPSPDDAADRYWDYARHTWAADMGTLLLHLSDPGFRAKALEIDNWRAIDDALAKGHGVVVAGLHVGPHAALPLILAQAGYDVSVIGSEKVFASSKRLAEACLPEVSSRMAWLPAEDPRTLLKARAALRRGGLVVGYIDLPAHHDFKMTNVRFLGRTVRVGYGLPYLASLTRSPIVPACVTREPGPRFTLRLGDAVPSPARDEHSVRRTTQELFRIAEERVRAHAEQWLGWQELATRAATADA